MTLMIILILSIIITILVGIFINNRINPIEKRLSRKQVFTAGTLIGLVIGAFYYYQQLI
ncbi:hypothetical protein [Macrococcoides caseolyticum]|uniref:hypothetical protein n=1 Tax=Macrococcoides caseolyticum TaxID=69966 RepID=UPI0012FF265A|nr:hypothetical protein [Macrococcus caseolyticus]